MAGRWGFCVGSMPPLLTLVSIHTAAPSSPISRRILLLRLSLNFVDNRLLVFEGKGQPWGLLEAAPSHSVHSTFRFPYAFIYVQTCIQTDTYVHKSTLTKRGDMCIVEWNSNCNWNWNSLTSFLTFPVSISIPCHHQQPAALLGALSS